MARMPIFPPRMASGYTLAELLVVLVILGLLTAIAAPRIATRSDAQVMRQQSMRLASLLRSARLEARREGLSRKVYIDPQAGMAWIDGEARRLRLDPAVSLTATGAERESSGGAIGIRFFANGMSTGGEANLQLGAIKRTIAVIWADGEVRLEEG